MHGTKRKWLPEIGSLDLCSSFHSKCETRFNIYQTSTVGSVWSAPKSSTFSAKFTFIQPKGLFLSPEVSFWDFFCLFHLQLNPKMRFGPNFLSLVSNWVSFRVLFLVQSQIWDAGPKRAKPNPHACSAKWPHSPKGAWVAQSQKKTKTGSPYEITRWKARFLGSQHGLAHHLLVLVIQRSCFFLFKMNGPD